MSTVSSQTFTTTSLNILFIKRSHIICLLPKLHTELVKFINGVPEPMRSLSHRGSKVILRKKEQICNQIYFSLYTLISRTRSNCLADFKGFNLSLSGNGNLCSLFHERLVPFGLSQWGDIMTIITSQ